MRTNRKTNIVHKGQEESVSNIERAKRVLYRVPEAMELLSLGRSAIYEQIRSNRLRSVKQGRSRLIPDKAIAEYVALLEREAA